MKEQGEVISQRTVGIYMRENGIKAQYMKRKMRATRDCDFSSRLTNILNRKLNPEQPNTLWCTDITYIWTSEEGFVYLTSVMDLYSRKIIGWKVSQTMETEDVLECLEEAKAKRRLEKPVVIHSDQGVQYISRGYIE